MKPYVYTRNKGIYYLNLAKTWEKLMKHIFKDVPSIRLL